MELYALRDLKETSVADPDLQEVDIFYLEDLLQKGRAGTRLLKATSAEFEQDVEIKLFPKHLVDHCNNGFTNELRAVSNLSHPSLVKYHAFYKDALIKGKDSEDFSRFSAIIREYIPSGNLFQLVSRQPLTEKLARTVFKQMISAIDYLHTHKIAHLDLKLESFLVTDHTIKLADFEKAQNFELKSTVGLPAGTSGYRPPEFIKRSCQDLRAADIYSLGVILFMMVTGTPPYTEIEEKNGITFDRYYDALRKDVSKFWKVHEHHRSEDDGEALSKEFKKLVEGMLAEKPEARLKIEEIKASRWYKGATCSQDELKEGLVGYC